MGLLENTCATTVIPNADKPAFYAMSHVNANAGNKAPAPRFNEQDSDMVNSLRRKTVVIAGGSSGMGLALARKAATEGAHVHILGRSVEKLIAAKAIVGGDVHTHIADIGVENDAQRVAAEIPHVDHLVITAAELVFKPFEEMTDAEISTMLSAKFWGAVYLVRHLTPRLTRDASITFFSGSAAYKASVGGSIVAALNGALDGLSRTLALELAPVRVNVVSPGVVDSPVWDFLPPAAREGAMASIGAGLPRGRVGTVDELADAALFLMGNGFTTGTVLHVDGGTNA